jgi:hypothetical protein
LAQELEPRTYSSSPVGTNFIVGSFTHLSGDVLTDPSLPVTDVRAQIDTAVLGYVRTFGIADHGASMGIAIPGVSGNLSGTVIDATREIHRSGLGDARLRFAFNLMGDSALSREEFANRAPTTSIGVSLTVSAPTGRYNPAQLVNIGTNRWSFKPEIGISRPMGKWFMEASGGVWLFTTNHDFFHGNERSQDPLVVLQLHGGYTFAPGLWVAATVGHAHGGATSKNGIAEDNEVSNTRYAVTLAVPMSRAWSAKFALSNGWITRAGGDYFGCSLAIQYRWFDR